MKKRAPKNSIKFHEMDYFPNVGIFKIPIRQINQLNMLINRYLYFMAGRLNTLLK